MGAEIPLPQRAFSVEEFHRMSPPRDATISARLGPDVAISLMEPRLASAG